MATNVNAAALDESPVPDAVQPKQQKQTVDPYNVSLQSPPVSSCSDRIHGAEPDPF
jgi:hypothetical protein